MLVALLRNPLTGLAVHPAAPAGNHLVEAVPVDLLGDAAQASALRTDAWLDGARGLDERARNKRAAPPYEAAHRAPSGPAWDNSRLRAAKIASTSSSEIPSGS